MYSAYMTQIQAFVHLELVDSHPKKSEQVSPGAPSQLSAQQFVIAVEVVAQQESKPDGFTHPVEGKLKEHWANGRERSMCKMDSTTEKPK
jgi:hypothetical protein